MQNMEIFLIMLNIEHEVVPLLMISVFTLISLQFSLKKLTNPPVTQHPPRPSIGQNGMLRPASAERWLAAGREESEAIRAVPRAHGRLQNTINGNLDSKKIQLMRLINS